MLCLSSRRIVAREERETLDHHLDRCPIRRVIRVLRTASHQLICIALEPTIVFLGVLCVQDHRTICRLRCTTLKVKLRSIVRGIKVKGNRHGNNPRHTHSCGDSHLISQGSRQSVPLLQLRCCCCGPCGCEFNNTSNTSVTQTQIPSSLF